MELILGNGEYKIESDSMQFIVKKRKIIKDSKLTKPENIGKEVYEDFAYCRQLSFAIKTIGDQILLDNKELSVIIEKLRDLQLEISKITNLLELSVIVEDKDDEEN